MSTGAAFGYYRIELNYEQNERQLEQFTQANYISFRNEFLDLLSETDYEFEIIEIPRSWLFSTLYPHAKSGDFKLNPEFEEFVIYKDNLQGFTGVMNSLSETLASNDGSRYFAGLYMPIGNLFMWLRDIIALDADVNFGFLSGASFTGDYSKNIIGSAKDILFIVSCVNAFEGWRLFENREKRQWRKNIDRLVTVQEQAEELKVYINRVNGEGGWGQALMRRDLDTFQKADILGELPDKLKNNDTAKRYIYELYTTGHLSSAVTDEAKEALASALHINDN